jgi:hypothetical protein
MSGSGASLVIARSQGTVMVTVSGELEAAIMGTIQDVLLDLIDGQGNVVEVDLAQAVADSRTLSDFAALLREDFRGRNLTVREPARRTHADALR